MKVLHPLLLLQMLLMVLLLLHPLLLLMVLLMVRAVRCVRSHCTLASQR